MYDYLIVGAGLYGSIFAHEMKKAGKKCLVIDKRSHIGGNIHTSETEGINVHDYGAHIFHTDNKSVWEYMNRFAEFNRFTNEPIAIFRDEVYNLPFNMNTFHQMWGIRTPEEARRIIKEQVEAERIIEPKNLEEQALSLVGRDVYEKLVKGYTEKQWGKKATELPAFIIRRLPVRFIYSNNYFNDRYQGIPVGGYTRIAEKLLEGTEVILNADFFKDRGRYSAMAKKIVFTGMIDEYFDYVHGELEYRSLRFEHEILDTDNFQGSAVVNYTEYEIPYTRMIEHKHFEFGTQPKTVITREYPEKWERGIEPYYPVNDIRNGEIYEKYRQMAENENGVIFAGRLGEYRYYDMHHIVQRALEMAALERESQALR
jgi:UDP-galactopyranose mutase